MDGILAKLLEKHFQVKVRRHLKLLPNTWFFKASERSLAGIPDVILCVNGMFIALELKRSLKSKATPLQLYCLELINKSKGIGIVATPENWDKIYGVLKIISEGGAYDRNDLGTVAG